MKLIERYIFGRVAVAFFMTLGTLTGLVWITQALRELDLITAKGQTILVFIQLTLLAVPFLIMVIAPFAVLAATIYVLNHLNGENELVVINAGGASRLVVLKPLMVLAVGVSVATALMAHVVAPMALRQLRTANSLINVDLVTNIIRPGRFIEVEKGLTFHIKSRAADGSVRGLMVDDLRDPNIGFTYLAERAVVLDTVDRQLLVMSNGTIQRQTHRDAGLSIIAFEAYAFDLSDLQPDAQKPVFRPSERSTLDLISPDTSEDYVKRNLGRFRSELHDRLTQPMLSIAFAMIVFVFLGDARTTREGRGMGIVMALVFCAALRFGMFSATSSAATSLTAVVMLYLLPIGAIVTGLILSVSSNRLDLPRPLAKLVEAGSALGERLVEQLRARIPDRFGGAT
ncbi:MAG: LPS export ABC transporter permease LptF [Hyphomicrobiaceae bacterium]|nr:LPS export ABC transporter permease LptF [Hyphomicrobiaceae bacterium]